MRLTEGPAEKNAGETPSLRMREKQANSTLFNLGKKNLIRRKRDVIGAKSGNVLRVREDSRTFLTTV